MSLSKLFGNGFIHILKRDRRPLIADEAFEGIKWVLLQRLNDIAALFPRLEPYNGTGTNAKFLAHLGWYGHLPLLVTLEVSKASISDPFLTVSITK